MYTPAPFCPGVRVLGRDGSLLHFTSPLHAARFATASGWLSSKSSAPFGDAFGSYVRYWDPHTGHFVDAPRPPHFICRTGQGEVVSVQDLRQALANPQRDAWNLQRSQDYRRAPVPGVHRTGGGYRFHRRPQTLSCIKADSAFLDTLEEAGLHAPKVGRIPRRLTAWDDLQRLPARNWKSFRQTQYRVDPR